MLFLVLAPCVVLLAVVGYLGTGEQYDPVFRTEELIARWNFSEALAVLEDLNTGKLDECDKRKTTLQRAVCLMHLGDYRDALALFETVNPETKEIADYMAFWMGHCAQALGLSEDAERYYAYVLDLKPISLQRDQAALNAARLAIDRGEADGAVAHYEALIGKSPREADAMAGLVEVYGVL